MWLPGLIEADDLTLEFPADLRDRILDTGVSSLPTGSSCCYPATPPTAGTHPEASTDGPNGCSLSSVPAEVCGIVLDTTSRMGKHFPDKW